MQPYGKTKRRNTIHGHHCAICSEQDLSKAAKHRARQAAIKEIEEDLLECCPNGKGSGCNPEAGFVLGGSNPSHSTN